MSADNWNTCPRCEDQRQARIAALRVELDEAYGVVPVTEFDRMRATIAELGAASPEYTFREDYEFYGACEGTVSYNYEGRCSACLLECSFQGSELFYQPVTT